MNSIFVESKKNIGSQFFFYLKHRDFTELREDDFEFVLDGNENTEQDKINIEAQI